MAASVTSSVTVVPAHDFDEQESIYLARSRTLHWVRLGIAGTIFVAAVAAFACEVTTMRHYNSTEWYSLIWLPLWPLNLDTRGTRGLIAGGVLIALQSLTYIVMALLPSPRPRTHKLNKLASAVAISGLITATISVAFAIHLPASTHPIGFTTSETIHSWSCKWQSIGSVNATSLNGGPLGAPSGFSTICKESRAGFILLSVLIGLEVIMGIAAIAGHMFDLSVAKKRRMYNMEAEQFAMATKHP
ncbi:hypothetical protein PISL3812_06241 [Talaromyces islandicus]|uniref:Uncharacterized protein n=1 Tax=Talaromyces islandicus TaxID=28573 RepID=A0A0U1M0U6_TALIS|nr:hypothetical protein PISL3812_06241 [Talaromyces islandicus]